MAADCTPCMWCCCTACAGDNVCGPFSFPTNISSAGVAHPSMPHPSMFTVHTATRLCWLFPGSAELQSLQPRCQHTHTHTHKHTERVPLCVHVSVYTHKRSPPTLCSSMIPSRLRCCTRSSPPLGKSGMELSPMGRPPSSRRGSGGAPACMDCCRCCVWGAAAAGAPAAGWEPSAAPAEHNCV